MEPFKADVREEREIIEGIEYVLQRTQKFEKRGRFSVGAVYMRELQVKKEMKYQIIIEWERFVDEREEVNKNENAIRGLRITENSEDILYIFGTDIERMRLEFCSAKIIF